MLTLQTVTVDDLETLARLFEELSGEESDVCKMKENCKLIGSNPNYVVLTAKEDNLVVGSVMGIICLDLVRQCKPFMLIENVVVKSAWHGRGIGQSLWKR